MNSSVHFFAGEPKNFIKVVKKFFVPFGKCPFKFFVWPIVIIIACWLYITTGITGLVRLNSDDALFLASDSLVMAAEPISDKGTDFTEEIKANVEILQIYVDHMKERHLADILKLLHPAYQPKKRLLPILEQLEKAPNDQEGSREVLWESGNEFNDFYKDSNKLSSRKTTWFKSEKLPEKLLKDLDIALVESQELAKKFEEQTNMENALAACQANRRTMLLLFLARMGYGSEEKIKQFLSVSNRTLDCKKSLTSTIEDPKTKKIILVWKESEQHRMNILNAMLRDDMEKVRELLKDAIDKAFKEKQGLRSDE
jgi:hypothetical protein